VTYCVDPHTGVSKIRL